VAALATGLTRQLPLLAQTNAIHGEILYRRGRYEEAFAHLYHSHLADPENLPLIYVLARAARRCGKTGYARHVVTQLLERTDLEPALAEKVRALKAKL
jgi:tetratricopeptide (TPR) repeat protein